AALTLNYGEVAKLSIQAPASDLPLRIVSSDPETVEVLDDQRLAGVKVGLCQVDVIQGDDVASVPVTVVSSPYDGLEFSPQRIKAGPGGTAELHLLGKTATRQGIEILPDLLDWVTLPNPDEAELEQSPLRVHGLKPTGPRTELLSARFGGQQAS